MTTRRRPVTVLGFPHYCATFSIDDMELIETEDFLFSTSSDMYFSSLWISKPHPISFTNVRRPFMVIDKAYMETDWEDN